jgi:hypothetical protein
MIAGDVKPRVMPKSRGARAATSAIRIATLSLPAMILLLPAVTESSKLASAASMADSFLCPPQRGALLAHDESDAVRRYGRVRLAVRWPDLGRPQPSRRSPRDRGAASQRPHPPGHRQRLCVVVGHHGLRILVVGDRLVGRRFAARARSSFWRACAGGLTMADIRPLPEASAGPPLKSRTPAACRCVVACDGAGRGGQRRGDRPDADARHVRGHRDAQPATGQPLHRRVRQSLTLRCERTLRTRHAQPARDGACPCDRAT